MTPVYWEHPESRIPPNVSEATRALISLEYPHESAEWVIAEPRRPRDGGTLPRVRAILARLRWFRPVPRASPSDPVRP